MAQISENSGGGKRSLNADLNLVPFIDLLSVCICFLLMTAVWLQLGTVKVKQAFGENAAVQQEEALELTVRMLATNHVSLELKKGSKSQGAVEVKGETKEAFTENLFTQVDAALAKVGKTDQQDPTQPAISSATVVPHDKVSYGNMIAVMDVLRKREIVNLAVTPRAL